jgi:hypothetical protein
MALSTRVAQNNRSNYRRPELRNMQALYRKVKDVLEGAEKVKARGSLYLPKPDPANASKENQARYDAYKTRAVFYAVTRRTLVGFLGELFNSDPVITVPPSMEPIIEDANGEGIGIIQLTKQLATWVIALGRGGIFVDYPNTQGATTAADLVDKGVRPVIKIYEPEQIINWRYTRIGALSKLSLIVLEEEYDKADDGFELTKGKQWRVLRLVDGVYRQALYRDTSGMTPVDENTGGAGSEITHRTQPASSSTIFRLRSSVRTPTTRQSTIRRSMIWLISTLPHYRNSADYEESAFICGQPTVWLSGLTQEWADRYFKDGIPLGARGGLPLPANASAGILQVQETSMAMEAMQHKERQMVALGREDCRATASSAYSDGNQP